MDTRNDATQTEYSDAVRRRRCALGVDWYRIANFPPFPTVGLGTGPYTAGGRYKKTPPKQGGARDGRDGAGYKRPSFDIELTLFGE